MWGRQCDNQPKIAKRLFPCVMQMDIATSISNCNRVCIWQCCNSFYHFCGGLSAFDKSRLTKTKETCLHQRRSQLVTTNDKPVTSEERKKSVSFPELFCKLNFIVGFGVPVIGRGHSYTPRAQPQTRVTVSRMEQVQDQHPVEQVICISVAVTVKTKRARKHLKTQATSLGGKITVLNKIKKHDCMFTNTKSHSESCYP